MTITYCKGLPTPIEELTALGLTKLELFLTSYAPIFHKAVCQTVNHLLSQESKEFAKSKWNTHLQISYKINKRHANGIISFAKGTVDSAKECRKNQLKVLEGKLKSAKEWLKKSERKLKIGQKFYKNPNWQKSKTGCNFPLSSYIDSKRTNWQRLKFGIHQKKRRISKLEQQIEYLKAAHIHVKVPKNQVFIVGSKDETLGNQVCQWDGNIIQFRVPYCLQDKFGQHLTSRIGNFQRHLNRLPTEGAKTWHFYRKNDKWNVAVQFEPKEVNRRARYLDYGCIGIDLNPSSIGWVYIDFQGNLKHHGKIPLPMGLPNGKQQAQIVEACFQLAQLANTFSCPVVCEDLDFSSKKEQLREKGRKYARMLSGWAYSEFFKQLTSILSNRGIQLKTINPAYTSLIGLVKYVRQYGLASDEAAALAIARRGMNLSEKLPSALSTYLEVNSSKHVWHWWSKLNTFLKESSISRRHDYYAISNWESLVKNCNNSLSESA